MGERFAKRLILLHFLLHNRKCTETIINPRRTSETSSPGILVCDSMIVVYKRYYRQDTLYIHYYDTAWSDLWYQIRKKISPSIQMLPPKRNAAGKLQSDRAPKTKLVPMAMQLMSIEWILRAVARLSVWICRFCIFD